jgi:predicted amidophosphoribosyltransferase
MRKLYSRILGILFPPKCVLCRKLLKEEEIDLCPSCRISAPRFLYFASGLFPPFPPDAIGDGVG